MSGKTDQDTNDQPEDMFKYVPLTDHQIFERYYHPIKGMNLGDD